MTEPGAAKRRLNADRDEVVSYLADLERDFAAVVTSASEGSAGGDDEHDPEGATVAFERQHLAALISQAREHLAAIDSALRKLDSGKYEICDKCGAPIGAERLAARPAAVTCVNCARTRR
jgi:RNA polymerase-binding transcription factor DksA